MKVLNWIVAGAVTATLAGCGAEEIASPGSGGNITINYPPDSGGGGDGGGDGGTDADLVTPATGCPTISNPTPLFDAGTISGPTGEYRVCSLPAKFSASMTLERIAGLLYAMDGRVDVGDDLGMSGGTGITLGIAPGVILYGKTGTSWLAVNRGNKLNAVGSASRPIIFTSRDNVLGLATDSSHGQWGGVVLMGRATITDCNVGSLATSDCQRWTEGDVLNSTFGGLTDTDSSGTLDYVQIRYSGYVLGANKELQSLTMEGVGSGTVIKHFQSHNSSDDGFEVFGGTVDMRNFVLTGADDDSLDVDTGYRGTIQYVIAAQKTTGSADSMIELDSGGQETVQPRTYLKLANFTLLHRNPASGNGAAMRMRGQADATLVNGIVTSPMPCLAIEQPEFLVANAGIGKVGAPVFSSVVMQCGGASPFVGLAGALVTDIAAAFNAGPNSNSAFTPSLTGAFINGAAETAVIATDPKTVDARFDTTNYIGAVKDANDGWYEGWTCNSTTANFGTASGSCTSLPAL